MGWCVHAQSRLTLCDPTDCSLTDFSVHGILQARTLLQGIFLIQGLNPHLFQLLHWQADSLSLAPPEKSFMQPTSHAYCSNLLPQSMPDALVSSSNVQVVVLTLWVNEASKILPWTSLVAHWLRIFLPMQGTQI